MALNDLSADYQHSALLIKNRIAVLRRELKAATDPEEIWHIKRRIAELTPMLTQLNDLAWMLDHYYERSGADRDTRYGFNGIRPSKDNKRKANENLAPGLARRIDRLTAPDIRGFSFLEQDGIADCQGTGREQKHGLPYAEACGTEGDANHEVLPVLSRFFGANQKDK